MIHRAEHKYNFTTIANATIRDTNLSDGAIRLLFFMLSCSDDYQFSTKGLAHVFDVSESTIVDRVVELKSKGYIQTTNRKNEKGRFTACSWDVFETPHTEKTAYGKNRTREKPHTEKTALGNSDPIRNNNIKELSNIKEISKEKKDIFRKPTFEEVSAYCQERNNGIDPEQFIDYYESKGWMIGKNKMKDWKASVRTWERNRKNKPNPIKPNPVPDENPFTKMLKEEGYSI
jgi:hypothetical protein